MTDPYEKLLWNERMAENLVEG